MMDKKEEKCLIIDIARPFDTRISEEKLENYEGSDEGTQNRDLEVRYGSPWRPWNGVHRPEEMVTGAGHGQGTLHPFRWREATTGNQGLFPQAREQQGSLEGYWTWDKSHQQEKSQYDS